MTKIKLDTRNYRRHNDKNLELIEKSLKECGAGRSILIDNENTVIAGNGCLSQAEKLNIPVKVIETDGTELIAIKRTDLSTDDEKRKQLAIMDNSTSDSSDFDLTLLQEDFDISDLSDWGVDVKEELISKYTRKISTPIYEIKGECPEITDMINTEKADKLIEKINKLKVDDCIKDFLLKCATRLYEFRYDNIAEYYAHQDKDLKEIMEDLALVIIDFKKAIELGYIELNDFIENNFLMEHDINV